MKEFIIKICLLILCFYSIKCQCIQGGNCPNDRGFCKAGECICINNFWTLKNYQSTTLNTFCNYQRHNHYKLLIFEFFIPTSGHFIAGKYYLALFKLILLIIPILSCIIGFCFYYSAEGYQRAKSKKVDMTRENGEPVEYNEENDNNLHVANREEKNVDLSTYLPVLITFGSLALFIIMHIIDFICYLFCFYNDGYGVPLA